MKANKGEKTHETFDSSIKITRIILIIYQATQKTFKLQFAERKSEIYGAMNEPVNLLSDDNAKRNARTI